MNYILKNIAQERTSEILEALLEKDPEILSMVTICGQSIEKITEHLYMQGFKDGMKLAKELEEEAK